MAKRKTALSGLAWTNLGDHQTLGPLGESHEHVIARLQVFQSAAAQGFNMDEDVPGFGVPNHEAIALRAIEPLDLGVLGRPLGRQRLAAASAVEP
jgi:hypothetical protein